MLNVSVLSYSQRKHLSIAFLCSSTLINRALVIFWIWVTTTEPLPSPLHTHTHNSHSHTHISHTHSGDNTLQSVSLSKSNFEAFLRHLLLVKHYRVEVYRRVNQDQASWKVAFKVRCTYTFSQCMWNTLYTTSVNC